MEAEKSGTPYKLPPSPIRTEDILFCIDAGVESMAEMNVLGSNSRPVTRLESIKQAVLLFVHSKLSINPNHRFAIAAFSKSAAWLQRDFTGNVDSVIAALRGLSVSASSASVQVDLSLIFKEAAREAKRSHAQNRILRVIIFYCRSSSPPLHQWHPVHKAFTMDVIYLHDKPSKENCPQEVFDALLEALDAVSQYEGYAFESGQGLQRQLFRHVCNLLSHPQQRCGQDELELPKSISRKSLESVAAPVVVEENACPPKQ